MTQALLLPKDPQFLYRLTFETWHTNPRTGVQSWERIGKIHYYSSDDAGNPPKIMWETAYRFANDRNNRMGYGATRAVVTRYSFKDDISKDNPYASLVGSTP